MSYFIVLNLYLPNTELISIFLLNNELRTPPSRPSFTCHAVRGFPSFAPCLEHVCAGGGGGSVAIEGFVLYAGGDYALHLNIMLLVQVWRT